VAAAIDWADCVLFFSEGEGLGIVILDTLARGRVPVVRRAGGASEALPATLDDCFIDSDSPAEFADRVERFMRDPASIRERVAAAARAMRDRKEYGKILADQYRKRIGTGRTRVLHVITRMIVGGAQENTLASVAFVDPARFDSDLWTGPQTGTEGDLRGRAERIGVLPVYFPNVVRELNPPRDMLATWQLYRMLRRRRYDIVHTHSSKIGIIGRLAARFAGVPHVVHTAHGWGFHDHMAGWLRWIYVSLEKLVLPMTDQLVTVSDETTRVGLAAGIGRAEDYALIRSGIPTGEFHADEARGAEVRAELGIANDRVVIGTVGRLSPQKNPLDFVRVAAAVCAKHERAHFVSIGEGPLRAEVEAAIREAGLEGRISLLGLRDDVPDLMRAMDLYIMTSLWEGLPRVVVQALATGVPVISYDVAGTKEIVRDGKNGFLVPPGDWESLAGHIDTILSDKAMRTELRHVCSNEFDLSFTETKMVHDLEDLYESLMTTK
ncbi:MAG: glycosyltransferase, partial [Gemmatimonadetes bacterium]|nr:glycosyltransferase [Gemmatimonadota bacterium]